LRWGAPRESEWPSINNKLGRKNLSFLQNKKALSFLKKRNKKLSSIATGTESKPENAVLSQTNKSFLVLFFKKERLAFFFLRKLLFCNIRRPNIR